MLYYGTKTYTKHVVATGYAWLEAPAHLSERSSRKESRRTRCSEYFEEGASHSDTPYPTSDIWKLMTG